MPKTTSMGTCKICATKMAKTAMVAHVKKCLVAKSGTDGGGTLQDTLVLRAQGTQSLPYWLLVGISPDAQLKHLDKFLREIWLECCGHLSAFSLAGYNKIPMSTPVHKVFEAAKNVHYEYDFGDTTALTLSNSGHVQSAVHRRVQLLARNVPPVWPCDECGKPARLVCVQCLWDNKGFCCDTHADDHECGEEMLLPVVNSPRMGVCGYSGEI